MTVSLDPKNPGNRTKAHKLRRALAAGQTLQPIDALWLDEYEASQKKSNGEPKHYGRSRSGRKIDLHVEEAHEAEGEGSPGAAAAGALAAREEGRRLDSLTIHSTDALKEACGIYRDMCLMLKDQVELMMGAVTESMITARTHYLARAETEAAMIEAQNAQHGNPADELLMMLAAKHLGLPIDQLRGVAAAAQQQQRQQQPKPKRRPPPPAVPPNGVPPA